MFYIVAPWDQGHPLSLFMRAVWEPVIWGHCSPICISDQCSTSLHRLFYKTPWAEEEGVERRQRRAWMCCQHEAVLCSTPFLPSLSRPLFSTTPSSALHTP